MCTRRGFVASSLKAVKQKDLTAVLFYDKFLCMIDKITEINLLYDFYATLLTDKQREVIRLYHCENLSLAEIGEEFKISRQGVFDALKNAEKALVGYEEKLGLMQKFTETSGLIKSADERVDALISANEENAGLKGGLTELKKIISLINV